MDMVQHQSFRPPNPKQITNLTNHTPEYPDYYVVPKPKGNDELHLLPTIIGVQGIENRSYPNTDILFLLNLQTSSLKNPEPKNTYKILPKMLYNAPCSHKIMSTLLDATLFTKDHKQDSTTEYFFQYIGSRHHSSHKRWSTKKCTSMAIPTHRVATNEAGDFSRSQNNLPNTSEGSKKECLTQYSGGE